MVNHMLGHQLMRLINLLKNKIMQSKEIKYVIFDHNKPILLSPILNHSDIRIGGITSAGFCYITIINKDRKRLCYYLY
jgi:hypothetical protein